MEVDNPAPVLATPTTPPPAAASPPVLQLTVESDAEECPVCHCAGNLFETPCGHRFHVPCLLRWNTAQVRRGMPTNCPLCRQSLLGSSQDGSAPAAPAPAPAPGPPLQRQQRGFGGPHRVITIPGSTHNLFPLEYMGTVNGGVINNSNIGTNTLALADTLLSAMNGNWSGPIGSNAPVPSAAAAASSNNNMMISSDQDSDEESLDTLMEFIADGDYEGIRNSISRNSRIVNVMCEDGTTPLHHCVARSDCTAAEIMLHSTANPRVRSVFGVSPLHLACVSKNLTIAQKLIDCGACVDVTDRMGDTPLHYAVQHGDAAMVSMLLQKSAQVNAVNDRGDTVCHAAARRIMPSIVNLLMLQRPALDKRNYIGDTALHVAVRHHNVEFARRCIAQCGPACRFERNLEGNMPQEMAYTINNILMTQVFDEAMAMDDEFSDEEEEEEEEEEDNDQDDDDQDDQDDDNDVAV